MSAELQQLSWSKQNKSKGSDKHYKSYQTGDSCDVLAQGGASSVSNDSEAKHATVKKEVD